MAIAVSTAPSLASPAADRAAAFPKPGLWRRAYDALMESRQRQADREIAEILARRGGIMADPALTAAFQAGRRRPGQMPAIRRP